MIVASIPSPHTGIVNLGPLHIHLYGLTLLVAILACVWLTTLRWKRQGGDPDLVIRVAVWGVAFGVVGARAYHDLTSWNEVPTPKWKGIFEVWQGGLGVWGGILLGTLAGWAVVRRWRKTELGRLGASLEDADRLLTSRSGSAAELSATSENQRRLRAQIQAVRSLGFAQFMDAAAPGLLLAQGIGRIGNWWNQELFGKPTSLPWGLKIDVAHRPVQYIDKATFHPTFLYELIWDVAGVLLLLWVARRWKIKPPGLFALYVAYYTFGRFFEELLRIDPSHHFYGLRLNAWVSIVCFVVAVGAFAWLQRRPAAGEPRRPRKPVKPPGPKMAIPRGRVR